MVKSPLSGKESKLLFKVDQERLVREYKNSFGIDILPLMPQNVNLGLYEDQEYKYKFYFPFNISGDDTFYQSLEKFDWYYMPWKWEHDISLQHIKADMSVLEVGCGVGGFLKRISSSIGKDNVVGLEMNSNTVERLQSEDYKVYNTNIEEFANYNQETFDIVCSYQVLEHISNVKSFIKAKVSCLKMGGKLIISVPNNDSTLLRFDNGGILNHPPHHQGLWNKASLEALQYLFPIKLKKIYFEPIQEYHWDWYLSIIDSNMSNQSLKKFIKKFPIIKNVLHQLLKFAKPIIKGHSIVAVYEKQ